MVNPHIIVDDSASYLSFEVQFSNAAGDGADSAPYVYAPLPVLGAVVSLQPADDEIIVQFTQTATTLYAGYEVMEVGGSTLQTIDVKLMSDATATEGTVQIKIKNLTNLQNYTFEIRARNEDHFESEWLVLSQMAPSKKPAAPTILDVIRDKTAQKMEVELVDNGPAGAAKPTSFTVVYYTATSTITKVYTITAWSLDGTFSYVLAQ